MRKRLRNRGGQTATRDPGERTVIPHAGRGIPTSLAARALVVPVIEPAFGAMPMAAPRAAQAVAARECCAAAPAVDVAAVAAAADRKQRLTAGTRSEPARDVLSHRPPRTAVAAQRQGKCTNSCDNPGGRAFGRATTTRSRPLRVRSDYSGPSLRLRERTLRDRAHAPGVRNQNLGAHTKEGQEPVLRTGRGQGPRALRALFRIPESPGADQA
jgi:hypothetical protein